LAIKNKRILITAGPTWVPIDNVRVISNVATGETGILLANKLQHLGARVTLMLGPVGSCCLNKKIKLINFRFFEELKDKIIRELKTKKYDAVIHSAAVSDYRPKKIYSEKLNSGIKNLKLNLAPTEKIINLVKKINNSLILVGFKFEPKISKRKLIDRTVALIRRARLDLAVANTINKNGYSSYIIDRSKLHGPLFSKKNMIDKLVNLIGENL
jgi:phosphopantothenoylcysteine decarboxylase/phosphopantothenate--cysteine ligase